MSVDSRGGRKAHRLADLAHRRRVPPVAETLPYVDEYLLPLVAQRLDHGHPFPSALFFLPLDFSCRSIWLLDRPAAASPPTSDEQAFARR